MDKRPVAIIVVGLIILIMLFTQFTVSYPYKPSEIVQITNDTFFEHQVPPLGYFGSPTTNISRFNPSMKNDVVIEGYATNSTSGKPIAGARIAISLFPATAVTTTDSRGFFSFTALYGGSGVFAFKTAHYKTIYENLVLSPPAVWTNLSFSPAVPYRLSGYVRSVNGTYIDGARITFSGFFYQSRTVSGSLGYYSLMIYDDTYGISTLYSGYKIHPRPFMVEISGSPVNNFNLTMFPATGNYTVSGYVMNVAGSMISGAAVFDHENSAGTVSKASGFYSIRVVSGSNILSFSHPGYETNTTEIYANRNITDFNVTLHTPQPLGGNSSEVPGNTTVNGTTLFNLIGNNSSAVNYSKYGPYILTGRIHTTVSGSRLIYLGDINVSFYISVNGTFYRSVVRTNSTGWYILPINYAGTYKFLVDTYLTYPLKSPSIDISSSPVYYNISLVAIPDNIYYVNGDIVNSLTGLPVQNSSVGFRGIINSTESVSSTFYSSNGTISFYLIMGNYTFYTSAPGYFTHYSVERISRNITLRLVLSPDLNLSPQFREITLGNSTGIQGLSSAQLDRNISNISMTFNYAQITVVMKFTYSGSPVEDTWIGIYIGVDGLYFFDPAETNGTGQYAFHLNYSGKFNIVAESQDYYSNSISNLTLISNSKISVALQEREVYPVQITVYNVLNHTDGQNASVPADYLNVTNSILPVNFMHAFGFNGTNFTALLPDGAYILNYSNERYVGSEFTITVNGSSVKSSYGVNPVDLLLKIDSFTNITFLVYSSGNGEYFSGNYSSGIHSDNIPVTVGNVTVYTWLVTNGIRFSENVTSVRISYTNPNAVLYLNDTNRSGYESLQTLSRDSVLIQVPITFTFPFPALHSQYFNQEITVNSSAYSSYINSGWTNVMFTYSNGTEIPAWVESNASNTATATTVWLKLHYTSGSSTLYIYMNVYPSSVDLMSRFGPTGENPYISSPFGMYDDGSIVFPVYSNFQEEYYQNWSANSTYGSYTPEATSNGVEMLTGAGSASDAMVFRLPFTGQSVQIMSSFSYHGNSGGLGFGFYSSGPVYGTFGPDQPSTLNGYFASYVFSQGRYSELNVSGSATYSTVQISALKNEYVQSDIYLNSTGVTMMYANSTLHPFKGPSASGSAILKYTGTVDVADSVLYVGASEAGILNYANLSWIMVVEDFSGSTPAVSFGSQVNQSLISIDYSGSLNGVYLTGLVFNQSVYNFTVFLNGHPEYVFNVIHGTSSGVNYTEMEFYNPVLLQTSSEILIMITSSDSASVTAPFNIEVSYIIAQYNLVS